jgi:hypothetical protein
MRLNIHARPSLVVLEKGSFEPELIFLAPEATVAVTQAADILDASGGNCALMTFATLPGANVS